MRAHATKRLMKAQPINPQPGRRLREIRECRGMSQGRLARALGVTVGTIQSYEHGRTHITLDRLLELAPALQCEPLELLTLRSPLPRYGAANIAFGRS
jgi:transcriptional regulator with XRE-family HTH domain